MYCYHHASSVQRVYKYLGFARLLLRKGPRSWAEAISTAISSCVCVPRDRIELSTLTKASGNQSNRISWCSDSTNASLDAVCSGET